MDNPVRPIAAALGAIVLLIGAGTLMATRKPTLSSEMAIVEPGPIVPVPTPAFDPPDSFPLRTAIFAGGCFWGVQGVYQHVQGVSAAVSGYSGGSYADANYDAVGSGATGHAEAVRISYDPRVISYGALLRIFFSVVSDPTTLNRQGPDNGTQYRTAIFPTTPEQKAVAERYIGQLQTTKLWPKPIVTRIERYRAFYPAESYHQDFLTLHPNHAYIRYNDLPKVIALKTAFPSRYRETPVMTKLTK